MTVLPETIAKRATYRPLADKVIAVRRSQDPGSSIIVRSDDHWRRNFRCCVISVGKDVKEPIVPGDVIWLLPRGEDIHIRKDEDPDLVITWERSILGITKSFPAVRRSDGVKVQAIEIDHAWRDISTSKGVVDAVEGDFYISHLQQDGKVVGCEVVPVDLFPQEYDGQPQ